MKKTFVIFVAIFWSVVTALLAAAFVVYDNTAPEVGLMSSDMNSLERVEDTEGVSEEGNGFLSEITKGIFGGDKEKSNGDNTLSDSAKYTDLDTLMAMESLKVRKEPSIEAGVVGTVLPGTIGRVLVDPVAADGYWWYRISYDDGTRGWSVENYLTNDLSFKPKVEVKSTSGTTNTKTQTTNTTKTTTNTNTTNTTNTTTNTTKTSSGISAATVAKHNSSTDCWMTIDGKVYDVTDYIPYHPGGKSRIINNCGIDATKLFNGTTSGGHRHKSSSYQLLSKYYVGVAA
ncbi:MAG: SH3 domain-containing protein [Candidatus Nomurabacteria bacterium]|nr:SH3 domain-containing protein [Candidatus Nomurabacteria bacterium]USN88001.1 MAG: SH3 domain-containing protein [Candidatus Nomurabacteria bacterium]